MSTATVELSSTRVWNTNWIINRREDLTWFIGSALISYIALALMMGGFPVQPLYFIWILGIDGPHVAATVTRTYFDRNERSRLGLWLWILVPFLMVGPVAVGLGQASLFYLFAICWQHFHIAKQHFGFVMLYKAKNRDRDPVDFKLDRYLLLSSMILPLALFVVDTQDWIGRVPGVHAGARAATVAWVLFAGCYIVHQIRKYRAGIPLNAPKLMLLATVAPLQWIAFQYASQYGADGILRAGIPLGMFHSFQYHRLMWFHNKNRYQKEGAVERYGLAATLAGSGLGGYLLVSIGLNLFLSFLPGLMFGAIEAVKASVWGVAFTHYALDARIWHVREDKDLAAALRMR